VIAIPFALIAKGIDFVLSAAIAVDKAITKIKPYLRGAKRKPPAEPSTPLSYQNVRRINDIARKAGHEDGRPPQK